jgi:hypothetical protein
MKKIFILVIIGLVGCYNSPKEFYNDYMDDYCREQDHYLEDGGKNNCSH